MADNNFRSDRGRDRLAELARLIGQAVPNGESAPANNGFREEGASHGYDEPLQLQLPLAQQLPGNLTAPEQACEPDEHRLDQLADDELCAAEDYYEDGAPRARRRSSVVLVMAIFALAVVGTAGAFGYRAMFGGSVLPTLPPIIKASNEPNKIAPASTESQAKNRANASQAGATIGSTENLFSREEQPFDRRKVDGETPEHAAPRGPPVAAASAAMRASSPNGSASHGTDRTSALDVTSSLERTTSKEPNNAPLRVERKRHGRVAVGNHDWRPRDRFVFLPLQRDARQLFSLRLF